MIPRVLALAALLLLPSACGPSDPAPDVSATLPAFAGTYNVTGTTIETAGGRSREISGIVVLSEEDGVYNATFDLETLFPTPGEPTRAQVVGTGEATIEDVALLGHAETQIILAQVPGVDAGFSFLPRAYGPRLKSTSVTVMDEDGTLIITIQNQGAEGEEYRATQTTLRGVRMADAQPTREVSEAETPAQDH